MRRKILVLSLVVGACGGSQLAPLPPYYTAVNVDHPPFPQTRYLTGVGLSGVTADDADERANANVSGQISAQLESETSSFQQYTPRTGATPGRVCARISLRPSIH